MKGQSKKELWHQIHHGRLAAWNHNNIFIKMNSVVKLIGPIEPKIRPLAVQIIFWEPNLKTLVTTWGFQNEQVALKMFYFQELSKHNDLKIQNCLQFYVKTTLTLLHHLMVLLTANVTRKLLFRSNAQKQNSIRRSWMFVCCWKRWSIDFIENTQILHPNYHKWE